MFFGIYLGVILNTYLKSQYLFLTTFQLVKYDNLRQIAKLGEVMKATSIILILFTVSLAWGQIFTHEDSLLVDQALAEIDLSKQDLMFLKDWSDETYLKNQVIIESINNPYFFLEYSSKLQTISSPEDFNKEAYKFLNNNDIELTYPKTLNHNLSNSIEIPDLIDLLESYIRIKKFHFDQMFTNLNQDEIAFLMRFSKSLFPQDNQEENDSQEIDISSIEFDNLIKKINWYIFYQPVIIEDKDYLAEKLSITSFYALIHNNIDKIMWQEENEIYPSDLGEIIIGSIYDDQHIIDKAIAIIDPAGNDSYTFIANNQSSFYLFDASGDDRYMSDTSLFSANYGFAYAYDLMGDDYYSANTQAASAIFGFNEFIDFAGNDTYLAKSFAWSAAAFASSLMIDTAGNDIYSTGQYGQAFASTWGFSLLLDIAGTDSYICGTSEFHAPLVPNDYRSMGQGMGFGMRPDFGGGIGTLMDKSGNDRYMGGVYAQGVGYWYGLGILIDEAGNDFYNAVYYPQGSGIHLAGGLLFDKEGQDSYYSKHGPGQGAGHDFGLGIFIDREGDDHYSIEGGNGLGLTNSVGIFLDRAGNDRYENATNNNYGYGKKARSSGSIGLFIDSSGKDYYPHEIMQDSLIWKEGLMGIGIDLKQSENEIDSPTIEQLPADIDSLAAIEVIFDYAAEWEVGNVVNRVRRAREILLTREDEAADYIIKNKINTRDTKEYRAIKEFFENSKESQAKLDQAFTSQDSLSHKNAISLVASLKMQEFLPLIIIEFYQDNKYITSCISALASFKDDKYIPLIKKYSDSPNEKLRFAVASALKTIDSQLAREELVFMKQDSSFLVRTLVKEYLEDNKR